MDGRLRLLASLVSIAACQGEIADPSSMPAPGGLTIPPPAGLRALTPSQYAASVRDVLGADPPVREVGQWPSSIAAARGGVAPATVVDYEASAHEVARWVVADDTRRTAILGCTPATATPDDPCARAAIERLGRRAFRRPLTPEELDRWAGVHATTATLLGDPTRGLEHALAGLLQSPHFLYRAELGTGATVADGTRAYSDHEIATRLSYLVWNTTPDDQLLDAADRGELADLAGLTRELDRLLADDRAREGLRQLFSDLLHASAIDDLEKDAVLFPQFTPELRDSMRRQLVLTAEAAVAGGDVRALFTTRDVFLDDQLAPLYGMSPGFGPDLVPVTLPEDGPRAGVLTLPGLLALHSYPGKTSPALRGLFVRKILLCHEIPPPPPTVDTTLRAPEPGELVTTRELVARHQTDPVCASCHGRMDPIGLALETFDAIGIHRELQNGLPIDPSGRLDGVPFADARGLGERLAQHPDLVPCFVANLYAFGAGRTLTPRERRELQALAAERLGGAHDVREAMRAVATSDVFRLTREVAE